MGKKLFYRKKANITDHPDKKEIPNNVIKKIMKMNELDIELYQYAKKKYIEMWNYHKNLAP